VLLFGLDANIRKTHPTAIFERWGFAALMVTILVALTGCAGGPESDLSPEELTYTADRDSIGLEEFLALDEPQQALRRQQAAHWLDRSHKAPRAADRIQGLVNAGGLTPDNPEIWLRLAHLWRWVGDYLETRSCLDSSAAAVRALGRAKSPLEDERDKYQEDAALRTALIRAWLHFDRAEYRVGLEWAEAGLGVEPGNVAALRIRGLLEGRLNYKRRAIGTANDVRRRDDYDFYYPWIRGNLEWAQGRLKESFGYFLAMSPVAQKHSAEAYRAMGESAERVGDWSRALKWFRESAAHLPFDDTSDLREVRHERLSSGSRSAQQPFWLAFGRHYVTGSRSAFAAYALERFRESTEADEREHWAGEVVNTAGILLRAGDEKLMARRARGLVFARTGRENRALQDLRQVLAEMKSLRVTDPLVEAEIGHVLLLKKDHERALPYLRRAVDEQADLASALSDLGLALIMEGDNEGADRALTKALQIDPDLTRAWYNRGLMHFHEEDFDQAERDLGRAAELAPENHEIGRLLQQVRQRKAASE